MTARVSISFSFFDCYFKALQILLADRQKLGGMCKSPVKDRPGPLHLDYLSNPLPSLVAWSSSLLFLV